MTRVLILGGGFAGLEAAIALREAGVHVTLVSERDFLFLYPTSIWVPTGEASIESVCLDLPELAHRNGFEFLRGRVEAINGAQREVMIDGSPEHADAVFIALGGGRLKPKGVENTFTICGNPASTEAFRDRLQSIVQQGAGRIAVGFAGNPNDPSAVRGGPAFEMMFNIDTLLRKRKIRQKFELTFFAPMAVPGARMGKKAVAAVARNFERLGIRSHYGTKIAEFDQGGILFEDQTRVSADLTLFVPGLDGNPVVKASDLPRNAAGFVKIDPSCEVSGMDGFYALGDVAALEGPEWRAKQGHIAEVMARVAVRNFLRKLSGNTERESYVPHLNVLCVMDTGNGAALVYRDEKKETLIPLPWIGHWLKKAWALYFKATKRRYFPRLF